MVILKDFGIYIYTFDSHYNMDWKANTKIGLGFNNSVIKRLWLTKLELTASDLICLAT